MRKLQDKTHFVINQIWTIFHTNNKKNRSQFACKKEADSIENRYLQIFWYHAHMHCLIRFLDFISTIDAQLQKIYIQCMLSNGPTILFTKTRKKMCTYSLGKEVS